MFDISCFFKVETLRPDSSNYNILVPRVRKCTPISKRVTTEHNSCIEHNARRKQGHDPAR